MKEIWKDIIDFEDKYQISNLGHIKSKARTLIVQRKGQKKAKWNIKEKILKPRFDGKNYWKVRLYKTPKESKNISIHRLVALHFIPNPEEKKEVNHIDGDTKNNCITNLQWVTPSENMCHAFKTGLKKGMKGIKHPHSKLTEKEVIKIRQSYKQGKRIYDIAKKYKISNTNICDIVHYKAWKHV